LTASGADLQTHTDRMADKRKSSNDKATSGGMPVEPVYPHLTRAIIAFCILGVLGHFPFHVSVGAQRN
jgi:hypothetical protein